jgi:hypothetical protein
LYIRPLEHPGDSTTVSMGGCIASCQNAETAEELADVYNEKHRLGKYAKGKKEKTNGRRKD